MARRLYKRLTAAGIKKLADRPGMHPDGDGLYLSVSRVVVDGETTAGTASWVLRYLADKRERYMGLGSLRRVGLAEARRLAEAARQLRHDGIDPIEARRGKQLDSKLKAARAMTFKAAARSYLAAHATDWHSPVHARQWESSLRMYAYPVLGDLPVAAIDDALVLGALQPIWGSKTETASRVRGRIERILGWAATAGHRPKGDNPARWKDHLENLLAKPAKAKEAARREAGRGAHHAALPYTEIGAFIAELRRQDGVAARALEFAILTVGRTGEVVGATWDEIKLAERLWVVPGERMKMSREHRVPLSDAAMQIIAQMETARSGDFVFPGPTPGKPLSSRAMLLLLSRNMGRRDLTVHGFRSSFSDWCAERTSFAGELREMALAHAIGNKAEAAYRRGDLFEKRRQLANAWARFCEQAPSAVRDTVVAIGGR